MTKVGQLIFNDGWEAGLTEGKLLYLIEPVRKKYQKGKTLAMISEELEADEAEILPILDCVKKHPDAEKDELLGYLKEREK